MNAESDCHQLKHERRIMLIGLPLNIFVELSLLLSLESSLVLTRHRSWNGKIVEKCKIFEAEFGSVSAPFSVSTPFGQKNSPKS